MTYAVPVIDLENVQLEAVRAGTQELGAVQLVNHGVPGRPMTRGCGRRRWRTWRRAALWRSGCSGCTAVRWA